MFTPPYLDLATVLLEQGKTKQGRRVLEEVIRIKPDDPQPCCLLGDSMLKSGEASEAIAMYRKALERDADWFPAMLRLAQALSASPGTDSQGRREAIQLATRACELTSYRRFDALVTLSDAHAAAGNPGDAVSVASQALRIATQSGNTEQADMARRRLLRYGKQ